jgi:hypothetical protein
MPSAEHEPLPVPLGMTSIVLGVVALVGSLLPVLGLPLAASGMAFGIAGCVSSFRLKRVSLRWSLGGLGVSSLALAAAVVLSYAPSTSFQGYRVPEMWEPPPDRPSNPPPARPDWLGAGRAR